MARWRCTVCGYIYDEAIGDPEGGAPAGTAFAALPDDWRCPVCRAGKDAFVPAPEKKPEGEGETTVSDVIVEELARWGVTVAFGIPGTSSLGIVDAIRKNPAVRYIVVRHEENAAMAASAYNKLTGGIAACVTIAGPGATNLATGLYDAKEDRASVIAINGQVEFQYTGPGGFQEIDQDAFFRPIAVFNNTIYDKTRTVHLVTTALKYAFLRRGVAQLSVPNNIQKETLASGFCTRESCLPSLDIVPVDADLRRAADRIDAAERPVILAGWGAYDAAGSVVALAEKIKAPILTTFRAKGIVPETEPWFLSILGDVGTPSARKLADGADLLITLGVGFSKLTGVPEDVPLVQVDVDPEKLGKGPEGVMLYGNCRYVLPKLLERIRGRDDPTALRQIGALKEEWDRQRDGEADAAAVPLRPPYIMKVLSETLPDDAVISVDVGENCWWFGRNFRMKRQRMVMSGYLATMGFGFPAAIAAKLAYPERTAVCITGDGGFSMAMADLVTAVKYDLPMVVVVLNNRQLAMIQVEQMMEEYPNFGTDLLNPDFVEYAEACGAVGIRVDTPEALGPVIREAVRMNVPVVVDVETDPRRF